MQWKPYDPTWLIELATTRYPEHEWLAQALAACTRYVEESKAYYYFIAPDNPNKAGSLRQLATTLMLEHPTAGTLIIDVLEGNRVGGIEFLKRL